MKTPQVCGVGQVKVGKGAATISFGFHVGFLGMSIPAGCSICDAACLEPKQCGTSQVCILSVTNALESLMAQQQKLPRHSCEEHGWKQTSAPARKAVQSSDALCCPEGAGSVASTPSGLTTCIQKADSLVRSLLLPSCTVDVQQFSMVAATAIPTTTGALGGIARISKYVTTHRAQPIEVGPCALSQ